MILIVFNYSNYNDTYNSQINPYNKHETIKYNLCSCLKCVVLKISLTTENDKYKITTCKISIIFAILL